MKIPGPPLYVVPFPLTQTEISISAMAERRRDACMYPVGDFKGLGHFEAKF